MNRPSYPSDEFRERLAKEDLQESMRESLREPPPHLSASQCSESQQRLGECVIVSIGLGWVTAIALATLYLLAALVLAR